MKVDIRGFSLMLILTTVSAQMHNTAVNESLLRGNEIGSIIKKKTDSGFRLPAAKNTVKANFAFPVIGMMVECRDAHTFVTDVLKLYRNIDATLSERAREARFTWKVYQRSHKLLRMTPEMDVKRKYLSCTKGLDEDSLPMGVGEEDLTFMKELSAECACAAQYITEFVQRYGTYKLGDQSEYLRKTMSSQTD